MRVDARLDEGERKQKQIDTPDFMPNSCGGGGRPTSNVPGPTCPGPVAVAMALKRARQHDVGRRSGPKNRERAVANSKRRCPPKRTGALLAVSIEVSRIFTVSGIGSVMVSAARALTNFLRQSDSSS